MAVGVLRGVLAVVVFTGFLTVPLAKAPIAAAATAAPAPVHPDDDYMGSTLSGHEPTGTQSGVFHPDATAAASASLPGMDVSHYQGTVDWAGAAANGAKFAYMKATEGTGFVDPAFATNFTGSANAGIDRGAYHFALPDTSSGAAQADYFLNHGGGWANDGRTLPPVLDIEYNPYGAANWTGYCYEMTPAQMVAWLNDFLTTIHNATNRWPVIYTTLNWWTNCTGNDTTLTASSPLWIAHPGTDAGSLPSGWSGYTFWQYASSGTLPGDQDWFNGSTDDLAALAGGTDKLADKYAALGGASSYLGTPASAVFAVAEGWEQDYTGGALYYWPTAGAHVVDGQILTHYRQLSGPSGVLGFPATDESRTPDGVGRYNHFTNDASIYWTPNNGAFSIHGAIQDTWAALGWEAGPMGYPVTDESGTPDGIGRYNHFTKSASIYWTPGTGAHGVQGSIRAKWAALGWETGPMGYPSTDELTTPDGIGRYNHFTKSASIYWTPGTGAHSIQGAIRDHWASLGWETGLGYPTTDESGTPDGAGRYNAFTNSASIYWTPGTGAWSVRGAIRDRWAALGWERSRLGYPTGDEFGIPGGRRNNFQHGSISWTASNGALQVNYS